MKLIDSHVHLNDKRFINDVDLVIKRAQQAGVNHMINVGSNLESSILALKQANMFCAISAAVGIHPHDADTWNKNALLCLEEMIKDKKVVAWGEIGLDYHYDFSPRTVQRKAFIEQLEVASHYNKPVIIHNREAHKDMLEILSNWKGRIKGVMHCFSGSLDMAYRVLDLGLFISIAGPVTFKNSRKLPDVVQNIPLEKLLVETDCPYLTPTPYRGKRNEPAYVVEVIKKISEIKNISVELAARQTSLNTLALFNLGETNV